MTGTFLSRVIWLINAAGEFPMALGGEENPGALMLHDAQSLLHNPKCVAACPFRQGTVALSTRSKRWPHPIIVVNDPCLFLVLYSNLVLSMCSTPGDGWNLSVIAMATFNFDCRASSLRNGVHWRDCTGK